MANVPSAIQEPIPDDDKVSRACFEVPPGVDPESSFVFKHDPEIEDRAESVYWRKYAVTDDDVHRRGCELEKLKQSRAPAGKSPIPYAGFRTAKVGAIRGIRSTRGYKLEIVHWPENGDNSHTHICVRQNYAPVPKIKRNDLRELIHLLFNQFSEFASHKCTS